MKLPLYFALVVMAWPLMGQVGGKNDELVSPLRTWKSTNGSSLGGILLFVDETRVVVKPEGREPISLKPEQLSSEDRAYLSQWKTTCQTQWGPDSGEDDDPRYSGSLVIIPKFNRPVRVDSKGQLKEPFPVLVGVLEKNPNVLNQKAEWSLRQTVEAHSRDGNTKTFSASSTPLAGKNEVSLGPLQAGRPLSPGKTFLYLAVSGTGKTMSNRLFVKVVVE